MCRAFVVVVVVVGKADSALKLSFTYPVCGVSPPHKQLILITTRHKLKNKPDKMNKLDYVITFLYICFPYLRTRRLL